MSTNPSVRVASEDLSHEDIASAPTNHLETSAAIVGRLLLAVRAR